MVTALPPDIRSDVGEALRLIERVSSSWVRGRVRFRDRVRVRARARVSPTLDTLAQELQASHP